jgi:nucleoside 2-deoxyribosyltransferase
MKVYVAGPMRGYKDYNFPAFEAACVALREAGYEVKSPHEMDLEIGFDPAKDEWTSAMAHDAITRDVEAIKWADAIVLLPGWEKSTGANAELGVALWAGKEVYQLEEDGLVELEIGKTEWISNDPENDQEKDILDEALDLTKGDRNVTYGDPQIDFLRTAAFWTQIFGTEVKPHQVALAMAALKLSRLCWSPAKRDSWVDLAGYARCGWLCAERGL